MLFYPYEVARVARDTVEVSFPQFPMLCAYSYDAETALRHVQKSLFALIDARISAGLPVPTPAEGEHVVALPPELTLRLSLHWEIMARGVRLSELALDLGLDIEGLDAVFAATQLAHREPCADSAAAKAMVEAEASLVSIGRAPPIDQCGRVATWSNSPL